MTMTAARPRSALHGGSLAPWVKCRPWRARIYVNGKHLSLGYYITAEEARAAHAAAVRAHLGQAYLKAEGVSCS
jgi:hypothetical protein